MSQQTDWTSELMRIPRGLVRTLDRREVPRSLFKGTISKPRLVAWGKQTFLYVKETPSNLEKSGRRLKRWDKQHAPVAELLLAKNQEEQAHDQWILSDLLNLGCSREEVEGAIPYLAVQVYIATHRLEAESGSPYFVLGTAMVLEYLSERRASMAARNLVARSEIPGIANSVSFISRHGKLDGGHVDQARKLLRGITCLKAQAAILAGAKLTASLIPGFFPKPLSGDERHVP